MICEGSIGSFALVHTIRDNIDLVFIGEGGIILGGSAGFEVCYNFTGDGTITFSGSPDISVPSGFEITFLPSGGIIFGGEAVTQIGLIYTGEGGIVYGGTVEIDDVEYIFDSEGGIVFSGEAEIFLLIGFLPWFADHNNIIFGNQENES